MIWVGLLRIGVNPSECRRLKRHGKSSTNRQPDSRICQPYDGLRKGRFYEDKRSTESSDYHLILGRNHPIQGFGGSICIFRTNPASDSGGKRPLIPVDSGHRFRTNPATSRPGPESKKSGAALDNLTMIGHHDYFQNERRLRCREEGYPCVKSKKCYG